MYQRKRYWPFRVVGANALAFVFLYLTSASLVEGQTTVFHGGVLIDGTGSAPVRDAVIVVRDSIVVCAGPRATCSSYLERDAVTLVDLSGTWIIPGLIDVHVHLTSPCCQVASPPESRLLALLQAGVTTVRDVGAWVDTMQSATRYALGHGQVELMAAMVERVRRESTPGPRIRYCGPGLYSSDNVQRYPRYPNYIRLRSGADIGGVIGYLVDRGATCIKLYSGAKPQDMEAVLAAAAARGVPGIGHSSTDVPLAIQLAWQWAEIHHTWFSAEDLLTPERRARLPRSQDARLFVGWALFDPATPEAAALAAQVAQRRIAWVPTLAVTALDEYPMSYWDMIRAGAGPTDSALVRQALFDPARPLVAAADSAEALRAASLRFAMQWVGLLHDAGVTILAGSDSPQRPGGQGLDPGAGLHAELEYLVTAGLSPMEALAAATRNAAAALGLSDRLGTVSAGKLADFVVLRADPLQDIRNTRRIRFVVFGGAVIGVESHVPGR